MNKIAILTLAALPLAACNTNTAVGNDREAQLDPPATAAPIESAASALANLSHGLMLPDDTGVQLVFHAQQLVALAFEHAIDRDARPARDHARDILFGHFLAQHRTRRLALCLGQLALEFGNAAIGQLACPREIAIALRLFELDAQSVELFLELLVALDGHRVFRRHFIVLC